MKLRSATSADAPILADLWYAMLEECALLSTAVDPRWREWVTQDFAAGIRIGAQAWVVAEDEGEIVACGAAFFRAGRGSVALVGLSAMLAGVYTRPSHRKRGHSRAIVENLIEVCRARGSRSIRLRASAAGRALYESLGFVPGDEMVLAL